MQGSIRQKQVPLWLFIVAIALLGIAAVVALYGTGAFASGGSTASAITELSSVQADQPSSAPTAALEQQASVSASVRLTPAEKLALQKRVDSGTAAVISTEAEFLPLDLDAGYTREQVRPSLIRGKLNAVPIGRQELRTGPVSSGVMYSTLATQIYQWRMVQNKLDVLSLKFTPINVTTREFLPGTRENVAYLAEAYKGQVLIFKQTVTLVFAYDGGKITIVRFQPHNDQKRYKDTNRYFTP